MRRFIFILIAAVVACVGLSSDASADDYVFNQNQRITSRKVPYVDQHGVAQTALDFAYKGPRVTVVGNTTNHDTYQCPIAGNYKETFSSWVAAADALVTFDQGGFTSTSDIYFRADQSYTRILTSNWTKYPAFIRVVASCTPDGAEIGYTPASGDYLEAWRKSLDSPPPYDYAGLARNAFSWGSAAARSASVASVAAAPLARRAGNRFALRNGTNTLTLRFKRPRTTRRPPAILFSARPARADCSARRMHVSVNDGFGALRLEVRCRGLARGSSARLKIRKAIVRKFRLRQGRGTGRVHLDKPAGKIEPLVHVSTGGAPCTVRKRHLKLSSRALDLRLEGRCGRVKRGAIGELAVGGLLAG